MAIVNASFENAGGDPGSADSWARNVVVPFLFAAFIIDPPAGTVTVRCEGFDYRWNNVLVSALDGTNTASFVFDPLGAALLFENFERKWAGNEGSLFVWGDGLDPSFGAFGHSFEDFESGWPSNETALTHFITANLTSAVFVGTGTADTFESGWRSNETSLTAFAPINLTAIVWAPGALAAENFEAVKADQVCTADPSTSFLTAAAHGFANGDRVSIRSDGGSVPSGLDPTLTYYVVNRTTNTFQVSQTLAGPFVVLSDVGSGTIYVKADLALFWTLTDVGV